MHKNINGVREPVLDYFYTHPEKFGPLLFTIPFNKKFRNKQLTKIQDNFILLYDWICNGNVWDCQNEFEIIVKQFNKIQCKQYLDYLESSENYLQYLSTKDSSHKFEFELTKEQLFYGIRLLNKTQLKKIFPVYIKDNCQMHGIDRLFFELYGRYKWKK